MFLPHVDTSNQALRGECGRALRGSMATEINFLYPAANRLVPQVQHSLRLLQEGVPQGEELTALLHDVSRDVNSLSHHVKQLFAAAARQSQHRRELWISYVSC